MRITQGEFSFLPDLNEAEINKQIEFALNNGCAVGIEYTSDPHPRNCYWSMFGNPMFDLRDPASVKMELDACNRENPVVYRRALTFDSAKGWESVCVSSMVQSQEFEPGFELVREETTGCNVRYTRRSRTMARAPQPERAL